MAERENGEKPFVIAEQTYIDDAPAGVAKIIEAIGYPEAFATDLSQVFDFFPGPYPEDWLSQFTEEEKRWVKEEEEGILTRLAALLGREVKAEEKIWALATEVENQL